MTGTSASSPASPITRDWYGTWSGIDMTRASHLATANATVRIKGTGRSIESSNFASAIRNWVICSRVSLSEPNCSLIVLYDAPSFWLHSDLRANASRPKSVRVHLWIIILFLTCRYFFTLPVQYVLYVVSTSSSGMPIMPMHTTTWYYSTYLYSSSNYLIDNTLPLQLLHYGLRYLFDSNW